MRLLENLPPKMKQQPPDMCTIDHLEPRWHPERGNFNGSLRKVAACMKCNNDRDRQQLAAIPVELLKVAAEQGIRAPTIAQQHADKLRSIFPLIENPFQPKGRVLTFAAPPDPKPLRVPLGEMLIKTV